MKIRITEEYGNDSLMNINEGDVHEVIFTFSDEYGNEGVIIKPEKYEGIMYFQYEVVEEGEVPHLEGEDEIRKFLSENNK